VSVSYDPAAWSDLFVATAGATAALAGLLFVAVSINVERILDYDGLPERGMETLVLLLAALVVSIAGLMPAQSHVAFGIEILVVSAALFGAIQALPITHELPDGAETPPAWMISRQLTRATGPALLAIGGVTELIATGGGLYWVGAAFVFLILGAVANAWVLLVEILR
jgi:hypothetical protein